MADVKTGQSLEEALLAEEEEMESVPDEIPADRDIQAFDGFGSEGVTPTQIDGEEYSSLD